MQINKKTYHIITIGCQMNKSDSERMRSLLDDNNFTEANREKAGIVILNTCGVRQSAEDRIYGLVPKIKKMNPDSLIVLAGCLSLREDVKERIGKYVNIWLPAMEIPHLLKLINEDDFDDSLDPREYLSIVPKYNSQISAFVPIGNGCDNFCAYCVVPYARGREAYRDKKDVLREVKSLVENDYKEITLIAQNVNSYFSGEVKFPELLKSASEVSGDFWLRFATSHPKDMSDELIQIIAENDKLCEHIHLPVQAGDDEVLSRMNRKYTIKHYKGLIEKIRDKIPNASISTDIIVGFPGETNMQFENTVNLFRELKFDMAYIAQYSPRPGTAAEKMRDDVDKEEKIRREKELTRILRQTALENNKNYLNNEVCVLIEGINKKRNLYGKTRTSKNVRIIGDCPDSLVGTFQNIKIEEVEDFGMKGYLI